MLYTITAEQLQALLELANRAPKTEAERLFVQWLVARLNQQAQARAEGQGQGQGQGPGVAAGAAVEEGQGE